MGKRIRLRVAYDGTAYHGWQVQQNGNTIEAELARAITQVLGEEAEVIGASRTDAGVHAYGNVAVFDTQTRIPPDKISYALNSALPADIRVMRSEEVPADWHPRRQNCRKTYEYRIVSAGMPVPTQRLYSHYTYHAVDVPAMREAAAFFVGEHDFAALCAAGAQTQTTVRTIYAVEVEDRPLPDVFPQVRLRADEAEQACDPAREIVIRVCGNGFLYNMVRILAGTLLDVGFGRKKASDIPAILESLDRRNAGPTLPPQGLFLMGYEYEEEAGQTPPDEGERRNPDPPCEICAET